MPVPTEGEDQSQFLERCMGDTEAMHDFPDAEQRAAFCHSQWENKDKEPEEGDMPKPKNTEEIEYSNPIRIEEIKAADGDWEVSGYVSIFGNLDDGNDIVLPGAFTKTLNSGRKVRFLFDHDSSKVLGATKSLKEDNKGLFGRFKISKTTLGQEVRQLIQDGAIDSFSFGYAPIDFENKKDGIRELKAVELYEASLVSIPMNDLAVVTSFKSLTEQAREICEEFDKLLSMLQDLSDKDRPLTDKKRNEVIELLETFSRLDAVRSDLQAVLNTATNLEPVNQRLIRFKLAELRKVYAEQ